MKRSFKSILIGLASIGLLTLLVLTLTSCGGTTKLKIYAVSGRVVTDNDMPLSGATVLLYRYKATNVELINLKAEYPNHGVDTAMLDDFDHRASKPVYSVSTDGDGTFAFPRVENGLYRMVFYKEGYGFKYQNNFLVDTNLSNIQAMLLPVLELPAGIAGDMSLDDDRMYIVSRETVVLPGVSVIVGRNVTLLVHPNLRFVVHGSLNIGNSSSMRLMSSDAIYSYSNEDVAEFESVDFVGQNNQVIRNLKVTDCLLGLRISNSNDVLVTNVYLNSPYQGMAVTATSGVSIKNSCFTGSQDMVRAALGIEHSSNALLEKNVFRGNAMGARIGFGPNVVLRNNYFADNSVFDFGFDQDAQGLVEYNTFRSSNIAIDNYRGQMVAKYNDIEAKIGIYAYRVNATLTANHNNLNCSQYGIKSQCMYYNSDVVYLDCKRNYWNTTSLETIMGLIYDRNNESESDENYHLLKTIIEFQPISTKPNQAGAYND